MLLLQYRLLLQLLLASGAVVTVLQASVVLFVTVLQASGAVVAVLQATGAVVTV